MHLYLKPSILAYKPPAVNDPARRARGSFYSHEPKPAITLLPYYNIGHVIPQALTSASQKFPILKSSFPTRVSKSPPAGLYKKSRYWYPCVYIISCTTVFYTAGKRCGPACLITILVNFTEGEVLAGMVGSRMQGDVSTIQLCRRLTARWWPVVA